MKILKNIVLCLFMAISVVGVSTSAIAADAGRVTYTPIEAIGRVLDRIKIAEDAIAANNDAADVEKLVKDAKNASKEINSEAIDRLRQQGNGHLAKAIGAAKEKNLTLAKTHLDEAVAVFTEMKTKLSQ